MAQSHVKQKLQASDGGVEGDGGCARVHQVQLVAAQVLGSSSIGGSPQMFCKSANCADIGLLRLGRELAHMHVLYACVDAVEIPGDWTFPWLCSCVNEAHCLN